jgi:hypothetical protein
MAEFGGQPWNFIFGLLYGSLTVQCCRVGIELLITSEGTRRPVRIGFLGFFLGVGSYFAFDSYVWIAIYSLPGKAGGYPWHLITLDMLGCITAFAGVELLRHGFRDKRPHLLCRAAWALAGYCAACALYWLLLWGITDKNDPTPGIWTRYVEAVSPAIRDVDWATFLVTLYFASTAFLWAAIAICTKRHAREGPHRCWAPVMAAYMLMTACAYGGLLLHQWVLWFGALGLCAAWVAVVRVCWDDTWRPRTAGAGTSG